jgi:hypothetical protein
MSKDFTGGIGALFTEVKETKKKVGRPKTSGKDPATTPTTEIGTREGETRTTFILSKELLAKVKGIAYWDRVNIKDVVERALRDAVIKWEDEKGKVTPIPGGKK